MQKGRLSAPLSSPTFTEIHQSLPWGWGCSLLAGRKPLTLQSLFLPPCTEYPQVRQAEGEYAFQAVQQIQHICTASDWEVTAARNLCPYPQYIFQDGNPSSRPRHSFRTQDARCQLPRISLGQRAACEPGAGTGPGSAEA